MRERVEFFCNGERLRGNLFLPDGKPHAALVLTGPVTSVKEQAAGAHARAGLPGVHEDLWLTSVGQIDFYDDRSADAVAAFFRRHSSNKD